MKLALILFALLLPASPLWAAQTFYKSISLEESESGTVDSTDFPYYFAGDSFLADTANGGKCVVGNSGNDIRFYTDAGLSAPLTFERVFWTNTTGVGEWHVKVPTLSTTTDTVFYVACGDPALTSNASSTATWATTFKGVYHLGDGTTLSVNDSTSNVHHGTNNGAVAGAGRVGGAGVFTSDYIDMGVVSDFSFDTTAPFTISAWANSANSADNPQEIVSTWDGDSNQGSWLLDVSIGPYRIRGARPVSPFVIDGGTTISSATWYLVTYRFDGTNLYLYLNGVSDATPVAFGSITAVAKRTLIGARVLTASQGHYFPGSIDEVRIENTARTPSWITATYNNQKASSTFTTLGSLTAVTGDVTFSDPRPTWFKFYGEFIDDEISSYITNYPWFTGYSLWPNLTANTVTTVKTGVKDLFLHYPQATVVAQRYYDAGQTRTNPDPANMTSERAKVIDMTNSVGQGAWLSMMPEWDGLGGYWIPVSGHPFQTGTRAGNYASFLEYVNDWTPLWTILQTLQATRGYWTTSITDFVTAVHYGYEWGLDMVLLERAIDDLGDISTGVAFVRGAAAQYNKPWGIDLSHYRSSANSVTSYATNGQLIGGWSEGYLKRHSYIAYMAGANVLLNEASTYRHPNSSLNPLGVMAEAFGAFAVAHPTRGAAVVPIALIMDHDHGFVPRHWLNNGSAVWYFQLAYNAGDWATENLFDVLYPGYRNHGLAKPGYSWGDFEVFHQEIIAGLDPRPYEAMPTSTYGDLFDVLLSDATLPALNRYRVIMPVGNFAMTPTLNTMFSDYATAGGTVVLNASQVTSADEALLGVTLGSTTTSTLSKWGAEANLTESTYTYRIVTLGTATTIATNPVTGDPVITRRAVGSGYIYFVTPTYMQNDANTVLLEIAKRLLGDLTATHRKGWAVGSAVDFLTTETETGIIVTVANNTGSTWNGTVNVVIGNPTSATEWLTSTSPSYALVNGVTEVTATVPAYDVRIFEVMGDESPPGGAPAAPTGLRFASLSNTDVVLIWTPNAEVNLAGYKVYGGPIPGQPTTLLRTITAASANTAHTPMTVFRDRVTTAGTKYYTVTAFNTVDEEGPAATEVNTTVAGMSARATRIPTP